MQRRALFLLVIILAQSFLALGFTNPLKESNGSDPFMVYHEGYYYLMTTTWSNIQIIRATTIGGLKTATPKVVWTKDSNASRCCNYWAPEVHWMPNEGAWFIYYSAGPSTENYNNQNVHALRGSSGNIWDSNWSYAGQLTKSGQNGWTQAIDGTILIWSSTRYLVYSSLDAGTQCLFVSQMSSATQLTGNTIKISTPTYDWERVGAAVNEGPAAVYHGGRTWIVYSGSLCSGNGYKLGQLELIGNPMSASSWKKKSTPIFQSGNGQYQPGHNGIFQSPSGNQTWNVYHAQKQTPGQCDGSRYTAVQQINFDSSGDLNFGTPSPLSQNIPEPV